MYGGEKGNGGDSRFSEQSKFAHNNIDVAGNRVPSDVVCYGADIRSGPERNEDDTAHNNGHRPGGRRV